MDKEQLINEIVFDHWYEYCTKLGTVTAFIVWYKKKMIYDGQFEGVFNELNAKNKFIELLENDQIAKQVLQRAAEVDNPKLRKKKTSDKYVIEQE